MGIVEDVLDGDTLILRDGRHVRLIGIDTPERGRDGRADAPGAVVAWRYLQGLLPEHRAVRLQYGIERQDRYGRLLAHAFIDRPNVNRNVQAALLGEGLAVPLVIPPNLNFIDCYQAASGRAQTQRRGLWAMAQYQPIAVAELPATARGYRRVYGRISRIGESRSALWLNLGEGFAVRIARGDLIHFTDYKLRELLHVKVLARGKIYQRHRQWRMRIRHPADLLVD